jgi:hypothetical protein
MPEIGNAASKNYKPVVRRQIAQPVATTGAEKAPDGGRSPQAMLFRRDRVVDLSVVDAQPVRGREWRQPRARAAREWNGQSSARFGKRIGARGAGQGRTFIFTTSSDAPRKAKRRLDAWPDRRPDALGGDGGTGIGKGIESVLQDSCKSDGSSRSPRLFNVRASKCPVQLTHIRVGSARKSRRPNVTRPPRTFVGIPRQFVGTCSRAPRQFVGIGGLNPVHLSG